MLNFLNKKPTLNELFNSTQNNPNNHDVLAIPTYSYDKKGLDNKNFIIVRKEISADFDNTGKISKRDIILRIPKVNTGVYEPNIPHNLRGHFIGKNYEKLNELEKFLQMQFLVPEKEEEE